MHRPTPPAQGIAPVPGDRPVPGTAQRPDADAIERLLPQTQCTQCGFNGCRPYAEAIAGGQADINRCPPGGAAGIVRLAAFTGLPVRPLDPECGVERPRRIAWIDPAACIGCTKCIQACPVDAIVGAPKWNHAVLADLCTGCDLCLPPCPVDCIHMQPLPAPAPWTDDDAAAARGRHEARGRRLVRNRRRNEARLAAKAVGKLAALETAAAAETTPDPETARKRAIIEAAIQRARDRRRP